MRTTLLNNAHQYYETLFQSFRDSHTRAIHIARSLAEDFLEQHGDLVAGLPVMSKPQDIINDQPVMARTYQLKSRLEVPSVSQPMVEGIETVFSKSDGSLECIDPFQWQSVIDDLYEELSYEIDGLSARGYLMCPYILLLCGGVSLDPQTFEPYLPFQTRYGVIKA